MLSVICIVNNLEKYYQYLHKSIKMYDDVEKIIIYNLNNALFRSAAQAYNNAISKASKEYLMFVHQDVFLKKSWKNDIEGWLSTLPKKAGIVGVAGALPPTKPIFRTYLEYLSLKLFNLSSLWYKKYVRSSCLHGKNYALSGSIIKEPVEVQTVDEVLFIIPQKIFDKWKFDEKTCNSWHLYAVDFSLEIAKRGYIAYIIPTLIYHASKGLINRDYIDSASKVTIKHMEVCLINTTMGPLPTVEPYRSLHLYFMGRH
ncbi:MAG: glycosyltransferase [Nitrososphaerota archaeon]